MHGFQEMEAENCVLALIVQVVTEQAWMRWAAFVNAQMKLLKQVLIEVKEIELVVEMS